MRGGLTQLITNFAIALETSNILQPRRFLDFEQWDASGQRYLWTQITENRHAEGGSSVHP